MLVEKTADPSALAFGRDDKEEGSAFRYVLDAGREVSTRRSPGFSVELGGFGKLHAPFFTKGAHRSVVYSIFTSGAYRATPPDAAFPQEKTHLAALSCSE